MWTLAYLEDVASDMSVLHRIDDMDAMPARRFFAFCHRLPAYPGRMAAVVSRQRARAAAEPVEMSLADWARQHPAAIEEAYERAEAGGR